MAAPKKATVEIGLDATGFNEQLVKIRDALIEANILMMQVKIDKLEQRVQELEHSTGGK